MVLITVPDPDLKIRGKGGRSSTPLDKEGGGLKKTNSSPLRRQFGLKVREKVCPPPHPPSPSPGSATGTLNIFVTVLI